MNSKKKDHAGAKNQDLGKALGVERDTSMTTLIYWNISKALHRNPRLDLKLAIKNVHERLGNTRDVNKLMTHSPEERHLACALLAWQELGNNSAESLYDFIEDKYGDQERDKGKQTDDTKSEPNTSAHKPSQTVEVTKPAQRSENWQHPICTHNTKAKPFECADRIKPAQTVKISSMKQQQSDYLQLPKSYIPSRYSSTKAKLIDSVNTPEHALTASNLEHQPFRPKCEHMDNNECKSCPIKVYKSEINQGSYGNYFTYDREEVGNDGFCTGSESNYNKDTKKTEDLKYQFVPMPTPQTLNCNNAADPIGRDSRDDFDSCSLKGPVVTLPPQTKVVMRYDEIQSTCARHQGKKTREQEKNIMSKIDAACCMDSACAERLAQLDKTTAELRNRAARLARREAERAELLERAEAAWRDLELGYQRRLRLAEEKEYDMAKQTKKLLEERNDYKTACLNLAKLLQERGDSTEKSREELVEVEKELCGLACMRMRLSEQTARSEASVTEQHIKVSQLDRDLKFKEDEKRRQLFRARNDIDSVRALTVEAERAMRAELSALREQVEAVSQQLLLEDDENIKFKVELDSLRAEKTGLVDDLEGCQQTCDGRMQKKMNELKKARDHLNELKDRVIECQCKVPIDAAVEAKRTPSLVALCACTPDDRLQESCSCTSLRSQLMSNLLADLFGGLQAELGNVGVQMPCQMLKCLEDKHNWDKGSVVKTNLRTFFSQLLLGELDIAIATAIEKYHARWVGASCADTMRMIPEPNQTSVEDWKQVQERAIERRAQKLASKLAEQLFQERADQIVQQAKDAVKADPPPCECKETAVFPCLVKNPVVGGAGFTDTKGVMPTYWRRTIKDVTQLRVQIEDLKKESLKKEDLKRMEENIFKLVQRPSEPEPPIIVREINPKELSVFKGYNNKDTRNQSRSVNTEVTSKFPAQLSRSIRKNRMEVNSSSKKSIKKVLSEKQERLNKNIKKNGLIQEFAVNTCFCGNQSMTPKLISDDKTHKNNSENDNKPLRKQPFNKDVSDQVSGPKHTKPINGQLDTNLPDFKKTKTSNLNSCQEGYVCFHKIPSNTSIDKLLAKLTIWKSDLMEKSQEPIQRNVSTNIEVTNIQNHDYESKIFENGTQSNISYQATGLETLNNKINSNKSTDINNSTNILPITDSEYMGAVNLDKSNDLCHCVKTQYFKKEDKNKNDSKVRGSLFKCINSELCECKRSVESKNNSSNIFNKKSRLEFLKKNPNETDLLQESQSKKQNLKLPNIEQMKHLASNEPSKNEEDETKSSINRVVKTSDLSCDCDYYVKLLGVTLSNISSHKVFDDKLALPDRKQKTETFTCNDQGTLKQSNKAKNDENELNLQCQCHVKLDEFKNFIENKFKTQWEAKNDKELDVPSFGENISNSEEECVCCTNCPIDETKELEVNTFYLLEEHLKGKLEELKKSCCKFSCLPADEEEKLFSAIIEKVRQIISSSTNELTCKCMSNDWNQSDGSWNRANTLLQEYLKTKIQKVQCFCGSDNQKQECVLPKVLDEIYCLIENDFQRLRNVYNYKISNDIIKQDKGDIPEKDTNERNKNQDKLGACKNCILTGKDIEKPSKLNSNKSMILMENISAQVSNNIGMVTKSIGAIEKETKNIQTSDSVKGVDKNDFTSIETEYCDCDHTITGIMHGAQEVLVNHHTSSISNEKFSNNAKKIDFEDNKLKSAEKSIEHSSPYIGYTIDCACKCTLGTCTCIKSNVIENNKEINNIWNHLTRDNLQSRNISYIMDSISEKTKPIDYSEGTVKTTNSNQTSKNNESDFSDEAIVLKDSKKSVVVSNNSVNTTNPKKPVDEHGPRPAGCNSCRRSKPILKNSIRSESNLSNSTNMHKTQSLNCGCSMVPVCHVKMLVDNIENRLYHSKCTCDSFNPRVCPIHSKGYY